MTRRTTRRRWPPGPLFRRSDAELVRDEDPLRLMMPHLSWGRNASAVYHNMRIETAETRDWLRLFNATASRRATRFHLFLAACARVLHEYPKLNRFVSGGRLYQRNAVVMAFVVKRALRHDAPVVTAKLDFPDPSEPFDSIVERIDAVIADARRGNRHVDRELALGARLPHALVRAAMAGYRLLDRINLLPAKMIDSDPSFSSVFVTNLGSVGLDRTWHHLFELGTNSMVAALGRVRRRSAPALGRFGPSTFLEVRWSLDERIADGLYCAAVLRRLEQIMTHPARAFGETRPTAGPRRVCRTG